MSAEKKSWIEPSLGIPSEEFQTRVERLLEYTTKARQSGLVLFDSYHIQYVTGFAFIPTERPIAWALSTKGESVLFVPRLELEHARGSAFAQRVESYDEYPGERHPLEILAELVQDMGIGHPFLSDGEGYPTILGYQGPPLGDILRATRTPIDAVLEHQMALKSENELALIRESVKWGNLAHRLLQRYTRVGATETEVSLRASMEATLAMVDALGSLYRADSPFSNGAEAGYRGQIGRHAALPHSLSTNASFLEGDVLVSGAGAAMHGYNSEQERTMLLGPPSDKQTAFFAHMCRAQEIAIELLRPGNRCRDVDRAVRAYFEEQQLWPYWRHHSGHAIGLRYHEGPFLDMGDGTLLEPGMVFTVEPGLYVPELGGFRHSDTVLVTQDAPELLTFYPRELQALTIPL